jgi:hypothetical protein
LNYFIFKFDRSSSIQHGVYDEEKDSLFFSGIIWRAPTIARPSTKSPLYLAGLLTLRENSGSCLTKLGYSLLANRKHKFTINAYGTPANGTYPQLKVYVDQYLIKTINVNSSLMKTYTFHHTLNVGGTRKVKFAFENDLQTSTEDRNLYVHSVAIEAESTPCQLPEGGTIAENDSKTYYQAQSVPYGSSCISEVRNCANGVLSGSYTFPSCSVSNAQPEFPLPEITALPEALGPRFIDGIEDKAPETCEAILPSKCVYVDSSAASGGNGTILSPFNSLTSVPAILLGGDHLHLKGQFLNQKLVLNSSASGTQNNPTVIKTWPGHPRAVLDGNSTLGDLITIRNFNSIKIQNLKVTRAFERGIYVESATNVILEDMVITDTNANSGYLGTGGGVHFYGGSNSNFIIKNSYFKNNKVGGLSAADNIGAISVTSDYMPTSGTCHSSTTGVLEVTQTILEDEYIGVRQKHSGCFQMNIHNNFFKGGTYGALVRFAKESHIHHNVMMNMQAGLRIYVENTFEDVRASFYNNNLFNVKLMANDRYGNTNYYPKVKFERNLFHDPSDSIVFQLYPNTHNANRLSSSKNIFVTKSGSTFIKGDPEFAWNDNFNYSQFQTKTADSTSILENRTATSPTPDIHNDVYEDYLTQMISEDIGFYPTIQP